MGFSNQSDRLQTVHRNSRSACRQRRDNRCQRCQLYQQASDCRGMMPYFAIASDHSKAYKSLFSQHPLQRTSVLDIQDPRDDAIRLSVHCRSSSSVRATEQQRLELPHGVIMWTATARPARLLLGGRLPGGQHRNHLLFSCCIMPTVIPAAFSRFIRRLNISPSSFESLA